MNAKKHKSRNTIESWEGEVNEYEEKKNFINNKGELVLPDWYDDILLFDNYPVSRIVVQRKNTFNIYDCTQRKFISKKW